MNYKIIIFILLIFTISNLIFLSNTINQDKQIRKEAYEMVNDKCKCIPKILPDCQIYINTTKWNETQTK